MSVASGTLPPPVSWAQRHNLLYVIIDVECKDIEHKVTENSFYFKGVNALDQSKKYEVTLNFLHPVKPEEVTSKNIGRCLEFTIYKKEAGPYWPTLTNDKTKLHFLKANFSKWQNESDDEEWDDVDQLPMLDDNKQNWNNKIDDFYVDEDDSDDNIPGLYDNAEDDDDNENKNDDKSNKVL